MQVAQRILHKRTAPLKAALDDLLARLSMVVKFQDNNRYALRRLIDTSYSISIILDNSFSLYRAVVGSILVAQPFHTPPRKKADPEYLVSLRTCSPVMRINFPNHLLMVADLSLLQDTADTLALVMTYMLESVVLCHRGIDRLPLQAAGTDFTANLIHSIVYHRLHHRPLSSVRLLLQSYHLYTDMKTPFDLNNKEHGASLHLPNTLHNGIYTHHLLQ